jgi:hypothetical protein
VVITTHRQDMDLAGDGIVMAQSKETQDLASLDRNQARQRFEVPDVLDRSLLDAGPFRKSAKDTFAFHDVTRLKRSDQHL